MDVEIDQCTRIEEVGDTARAFSNGKHKVIVIPGEVKRQAEAYLKRQYKRPRNPHVKIFSAGLILLLKDYLNENLHITIDTEFPGEANEASIKGMLLNYIRRAIPHFPKDNIRFGRIGKKSPAHHLAYKVNGMSVPEKKKFAVKLEELLELL